MGRVTAEDLSEVMQQNAFSENSTQREVDIELHTHTHTLKPKTDT